MEGNTAAEGDATDDANKIVSEGLRFVFSKERDIFPIYPCYYADDGDPSMYTAENMEKRRGLKTNDIVQSAIKDFMQESF